MHTFPEKPKAAQQDTSTNASVPGTTHCGQRREVNSILPLEHQAVQRSLQTTAEQHDRGPETVPMHGEIRTRSPGTPLDSGTRARSEPRFVQDFS
jgi:hypothetical protein